MIVQLAGSFVNGKRLLQDGLVRESPCCVRRNAGAERFQSAGLEEVMVVAESVGKTLDVAVGRDPSVLAGAEAFRAAGAVEGEDGQTVEQRFELDLRGVVLPGR